MVVQLDRQVATGHSAVAPPTAVTDPAKAADAVQMKESAPSLTPYPRTG